MPELSPNEQFQQVLNVVSQQVKENQILIRFGPNGKLRFVIDEARLKEALAQTDVDRDTFRTIFDNEVGPLLESVIQKKPEKYLRMPSPFLADAEPEVIEQRKHLLRERARMIEERLFSPELNARYLVKVSSKHPRLKSSSWEVAKKLRLSTKEELLYPYTTLRLETTRPIEDSELGIFSWIFPEIGPTESIAFDCDEGDLDDLIQLLKDAKAALQETPKGT